MRRGRNNSSLDQKPLIGRRDETSRQHFSASAKLSMSKKRDGSGSGGQRQSTRNFPSLANLKAEGSSSRVSLSAITKDLLILQQAKLYKTQMEMAVTGRHSPLTLHDSRYGLLESPVHRTASSQASDQPRRSEEPSQSSKHARGRANTMCGAMSDKEHDEDQIYHVTLSKILRDMKTKIRDRWKKASKTIVFMWKACRVFAGISYEVESHLKTFVDIWEGPNSKGYGTPGHERKMTLLMDPVRKGTRGGELILSSTAQYIMSMNPEERTEVQIITALSNLQSVEQFCAYPLSVQRNIARYGYLLQVDKNRVIIRQGHVPESWYFVVSGKALVTQIKYVGEPDSSDFVSDPGDSSEFDEDFSKQIKTIKTILKRGMTFGELGILSGRVRFCTVTSRKPMQLIMIHKDVFGKVFQSQFYSDDPVPDYISFLRGLPFMRDWPWESLVNHKTQCFLHYCRNNIVLVKDSTDNEWIYVVRSGKCVVYMYVESTKASWRDLELTLGHPSVNIDGRPAPRTDCGKTVPRTQTAYKLFNRMSSDNLVQRDISTMPALLLGPAYRSGLRPWTRRRLLGTPIRTEAGDERFRWSSFTERVESPTHFPMFTKEKICSDVDPFKRSIPVSGLPQPLRGMQELRRYTFPAKKSFTSNYAPGLFGVPSSIAPRSGAVGFANPRHSLDERSFRRRTLRSASRSSRRSKGSTTLAPVDGAGVTKESMAEADEEDDDKSDSSRAAILPALNEHPKATRTVGSRMLNSPRKRLLLEAASKSASKMRGKQTQLCAVTSLAGKQRSDSKKKKAKATAESVLQRRKRYQIPNKCLPLRPHQTMKGPEKYVIENPPVYVEIATLYEGQTFGLDGLHEPGYESRPRPPKVSLVSCGAEMIMLSKRFFTTFLPEKSMLTLPSSMPDYPTPESVRTRLRLELAWKLWCTKVCDEFYEDLANGNRKAAGCYFNEPDSISNINWKRMLRELDQDVH